MSDTDFVRSYERAIDHAKLNHCSIAGLDVLRLYALGLPDVIFNHWGRRLVGDMTKMCGHEIQSYAHTSEDVNKARIVICLTQNEKIMVHSAMTTMPES